MRIAIYTLGCKVNQFESQAISEEFAALGHKIVSWRERADLYVVNTCAVTARGASQSRQMIRRFRRENPDARIVATGCHVQTDASAIMKAGDNRISLAGNDQKHRIVEIALDQSGCLSMFVGDIFRVSEISPFLIHSPSERTRAFVRVQDGCEAFCSYCIVPYARGKSRSMPPGMVHDQVAILASEGVQEIVITGIHVGHYGLDLKERTSLLSLMSSLCASHPDVRFRLSSIDPSEITDEMISWASATPNFCPHWHLPLQSGSDLVLRAMNRRYTASEFCAVVEKLYAAMPQAAYGFDVMTGFPGESDEEFMETVRVIETLPVSYLHVFPYSPRPATVAAAMKAHVPKKVKNARAALLRRLGTEKKLEFYSRNLGYEHELLVERWDEMTGRWHGVTENYLSTFLETDVNGVDLRNRVLRVKIKEIRERVAVAELLES